MTQPNLDKQSQSQSKDSEVKSQCQQLQEQNKPIDQLMLEKADQLVAQKLMRQLSKKYGDQALFQMGKDLKKTEIQVLPTGNLSLDLATGVGGFPRGRIVEIFGPERTGKSTLLLTTIAETQKRGGNCAFIDMEHALTPSLVKLLGVDIDNLYISRPDNGNDALQIMETLIESGLFDIVGLDSVSALTTQAELASDYNQQHIAPLAKLMSRALRCMTATISKTQTVAVFINQIREKPMVMFGKPEYTTGGKALKFYASLRIEVRKGAEEKVDNKTVGHILRCIIEKNKVAPPFSQCEIKLNYHKGTDKLHDLLMVAKQLDVIDQTSSWFKYKNHSWNGLEQVKEALVKDATLLTMIHNHVIERIRHTNDQKEKG